MPAPTAIFDLDGTLAETVGDLVATTNAVLMAQELPPLSVEASRNSAGMGGKALMRLAYSQAGRQVSDAELDAMYPRFVEHYDENLDGHSHLYPGALDALKGLREEGFLLGVCTNKPAAPTRKLLEYLQVTDLFDAVLGADTLPVRKPDPIHLHETVRRAGGHSHRAVMVGDSEVDLATARAAGVPCILVSYGYSPTPVEDLGADAVVDSFGEIPEKIFELLPAG